MSENWPPTLFSAAHNLRSRQVNDCRPSRKDMFTQNVVNIQSYVFRVILACLSMAVSPSVTRIGRCKMLAYLALQQAQQEPLHWTKAFLPSQGGMSCTCSYSCNGSWSLAFGKRGWPRAGTGTDCSWAFGPERACTVIGTTQLPVEVGRIIPPGQAQVTNNVNGEWLLDWLDGSVQEQDKKLGSWETVGIEMSLSIKGLINNAISALKITTWFPSYPQ